MGCTLLLSGSNYYGPQGGGDVDRTFGVRGKGGLAVGFVWVTTSCKCDYTQTLHVSRGPILKS